MSVVEGSDRELKLVGMVDHGFEVSHGVAVHVDVHLAAKGCAERLPLEILGQVRVHAFNAESFGLVAPVVLLADDVASLFKGAAELVALTHAACRDLVDASVGALGVLTTGHLHVAPVEIRISEHICSRELFAAVGLACSKLEHERLSANIVARARQD